MAKNKASKNPRGSHASAHHATVQVHTGSGTGKKVEGRNLSFKWLAVIFVLIFGALGSYLLFASHADTVNSHSLYQLYKTGGHHVFTSSATEKSTFVSKGYTLQNTFPYANPAGSAPANVYRLYNATYSQYFLTASASYKDSLVAGGKWAYQGVAFTTATSSKAPYGYCREAWYQLYDATTHDHFYTPSASYKNTLVAGGNWVYQQVAFSLDKACTTNPAPVTCTAIANGQKCSDGSIRCSTGFVLSAGACVKPVTCTAIANGQKCSDGSIRCSTGYTKDAAGTGCTKIITCTAIANGQKCSDGKITCKATYFVKAGACTRITCAKIANGQKCNDGRITCNTGYFVKSGACIKITCSAIAHGKKCNNAKTYCDTGYYLKSGTTCTKIVCGTIAGGQACTNGKVTCNPGFMLKGATCLTITCTTVIPGGMKCTDGSIRCSTGYAKDADNGCTKIVGCQAVAHGKQCDDGSLKCDTGYTVSSQNCVKLVCSKVAHGKKCNDATLVCDTGYYNKEFVCTKDVCKVVANGTLCQSGTLKCDRNYTANSSHTKCVRVICITIANGKDCSNGSIICNAGYTKASGACARITCSPVPSGRTCTDGSYTCDAGYFLTYTPANPSQPGSQKTQSCTRLACNDKVSGGVKCNNGTLKCSAGYFVENNKCAKIICKDTAHGQSCNDGTLKCTEKGYALSDNKKKCVIDNNIVVAYFGYNDGCGGTATHYTANKKTHVSQKNYGKDSVCVCNSGKVITYGKDGTPMSDSKTIKQCGVVVGRSTPSNPSSGSSSTGHSGSTQSSAGSSSGRTNAGSSDDGCGPAGNAKSSKTCACSNNSLNPGAIYNRQGSPRTSYEQLCNRVTTQGCKNAGLVYDPVHDSCKTKTGSKPSRNACNAGYHHPSNNPSSSGYYTCSKNKCYDANATLCDTSGNIIQCKSGKPVWDGSSYSMSCPVPQRSCPALTTDTNPKIVPYPCYHNGHFYDGKTNRTVSLMSKNGTDGSGHRVCSGNVKVYEVWLGSGHDFWCD